MNAPVPKNGQPQPKITHDPQRQVLCPACGSENLTPRLHAYRIPGQIIGSVDVTVDQFLRCEDCKHLVDIARDPLRRDIEKLEKNPA